MRRRRDSGSPGDDARHARLRARAGVLAAGLTCALAAGCRGADGPGDPTAVHAIVITIARPQLPVGATTTATATLLDRNGNEVRDRVATWQSLTPAVVAVTEAGVIMGLQPGAGSVRASSGSVTADAVVLVYNPPAASIVLARDTATLSLPGGSVQAIATATDNEGHPLVNPSISWTSQQPLVAAVNVVGLVTAIASGSAAITATIDGLTATMRITVRPAPATGAPVITGIAPPVLRPGGTYAVAGANFAATPAQNQVLVDGILATVQSASATQLTVVLPAVGFSCEPSRDAFMQVTSAGVLGGGALPLEVARRLVLTAGQSAVLTAPEDVQCSELVPGDGRWVVSVYNATRAAVTPAARGSVEFQLRGVAGAALPGSARADAARPGARTAEAAEATADGRRTGDKAAVRHLAMLAWNVDALRSAQARGDWRRAAVRSVPPAPRIQRDLSTPGTITNVRLPSLDAPDACVTNTPINARTVFAGEHSVILEDTVSSFGGQATLKGQMDDYFMRLGTEFEAVMWPILTAMFGDPLAMDAQLSGLGKVVMVFSPRVNAMQGGAVTGFTVNCDFFPVATRPSSNGGSFFYATVPTSTAAGYDAPGTRDAWMRLMRSTVIHEVKHIVGFAERLSRGLPLEELSWEEGTARIAEEVYARDLYGTTAGTNTSYAQSIACDVRFAGVTPPCAGRPLLMLRHFDALYAYMAGPEVFSPLGRAATGDVSFYGGAWSLLRWAADHASATEAQFFRDFTTSGVTGVANVEARTGRPWAEMLGEWSVAAYTDDIGGFAPGNPRLRMRSWNYPDVWLGLCTDMGPCVDPSNPVQVYTRSTPFAPRQRSFGAFQFGVGAMVGGGFTLLDLSGPGFTSQAIEIKGPGGIGSAPSTVHVAVTRVR